MAKKDQDDDIQQDDPADTSIAVNDAWTGMLAISLFALIVGTAFLAWDYSFYFDGDVPKTHKIASTPPNVAPPAKAPDAK